MLVPGRSEQWHWQDSGAQSQITTSEGSYNTPIQKIKLQISFISVQFLTDRV